MDLNNLLSQVKTKHVVKQGAELLEGIAILDITIDSRKISAAKSAIFFALDGKTKNGADFIQSSVDKGAMVIVAKVFCDDPRVISIKTDNPFQLLVECLKLFYKPLPSNIYAVTGTNGKTSTAEFIRQIINFLGKKSASIGTLGIVCDEAVKPQLESFDLTTPDIVSLYKNLFYLRASGVNDVAIEVSSIGLEQARIAGLKIDVAGFTNFTQDHLDYHKSMEEYFLCKMLLFEAAMENGSAVVLNSDIAEFSRIKKMCEAKKHHILDYGFKANGLKILAITQEAFGQIISFQCGEKKFQITLNIAGEFQAFNALCALGMIMAKHVLDETKLTKLLQKFSQLIPASGRMQRVATLENKAQVFIDFAHSPDALENVLKLARGLLNKDISAIQKVSRLIILFGCGGDRDNKKRPIMGEIASRLADIVIITDDNPRTEDADFIRKEIISSCNMLKTIEIADRKLAIKQALEMLQPEDILILAGKGHEKYQIIGATKFEFDEEKIVNEFLFPRKL